MPHFISFCQHFVPDFPSLMFCQLVIGQSFSPASFLNLSIKSCRTIIELPCTFLLNNKLYCECSLEKFLFYATIIYYSRDVVSRFILLVTCLCHKSTYSAFRDDRTPEYITNSKSIFFFFFSLLCDIVIN